MILRPSHADKVILLWLVIGLIVAALLVGIVGGYIAGSAQTVTLIP